MSEHDGAPHQRLAADAPRPSAAGGPGAQRGVRSWVRREGRITPAQARALQHAAGNRLVSAPPPGHSFDARAHFRRQAPLTLEIGCGNGEFITQRAAACPGEDFIGLEVHRPGLGHALHAAALGGLQNLAFFELDAAEHLDRLLPDDTLSACCIFFPDPWPKKRHHKRRLLQPTFARVLWRKLRAEARLFLATDWADYHAWMLEVFEPSPDWSNALGAARDAPRPAWRPLTRFEGRGQRLGHRVHDLIYLPVGKSAASSG